MAFTIRLAEPHDRSGVRRFVVINHLNGEGCHREPPDPLHRMYPLSSAYCSASSFNPRALELQIADLSTDFPDLYDDAIFAGRTHWTATSTATGKMIGAIGACEVDAAGVRTVDIMHLFVDPDHQRLGCGRALLNTALEHFQTRGCVRSQLLTLRGVYGGACWLYESVGFRVYREEDSEVYVLLRYELHFGQVPTPLPPPASAAPLRPDTQRALDAWHAAGPAPWSWPGRAEAIEAAAACDVIPAA